MNKVYISIKYNEEVEGHHGFFSENIFLRARKDKKGRIGIIFGFFSLDLTPGPDVAL